MNFQARVIVQAEITGGSLEGVKARVSRVGGCC